VAHSNKSHSGEQFRGIPFGCTLRKVKIGGLFAGSYSRASIGGHMRVFHSDGPIQGVYFRWSTSLGSFKGPVQGTFNGVQFRGP
jgi:hypothetical protein